MDEQAGSHAGLLLQRYLTAHKPRQRDNTETMPEEQLLERAQGVKASEVYRAAFNRWKGVAQQQLTGRARVHFTVQAQAPIAIGLGNASPLEVGIRLHHTYGMPLLPASALKGMCRRVAYLLHRETKLPKEAIDALFGYSDDKDAAAGAIVFYDAYYDPASAGSSPFHRDVITVHHPNYYIGGKEAPTDFDDPTPVPFLVIKPGAQFLCVLDAPNPDWANFAKEMLLWGLQNLGIGAKTNAGYGYLVPVGSTAATSAAAAAPRASVALQANEEQWEKAYIAYDAGRKILTATNQATRQRAEAQGAQVQELLESLPDAPRTRLLEKKSLTADVVVEQLGNQRKIKRILPPETG
ncbi:MAG: type III-B CRISPR module RAMP protein Cmr6 [Fimbriimonadales bacterium]